MAISCRYNFRIILSEFFSDVVMVSLAAVAGNQFTEESGKEELEAKENRYKSEIEERLLGYRPESKSVTLLYQLLGYDPDCQNSSSKEHEYTSETEEVHRLFAEGAQEPQRNQVKKSVHKSLKSEFTYTIFPLLVLYRFFRNPAETGIFGEVRYVSMHFTIYLDILDNLVPVRLQAAVHIMKFDSGYLACRGIIQLRREILGEFVVESLLLPS